jgi:hypothetical protein
MTAKLAKVGAATCGNWSPGFRAFQNSTIPAAAAKFQGWVDAGKMTYNATAGAACLAAINAATCEELRAIDMPSACDNVFTGLVAAGGACESGEVCVSGSCDTTATCPGTCDPGSGPTVANGGACTSDMDCVSRYCDFTGSPVCAPIPPPAAVGATCSNGPQECVSGAFCDAGTCATLVPLNGTCTWDWECALPNTCAGGTCKARAAIGASCVAADCVGGAFCDAGTCAEVPSTAGADCSATNECLSYNGSLVCDTMTTLTCVAAPAYACWMNN